MATIRWTGAVSGDWATAANWSTGTVPVAADNVFLIDNDVDIDNGLDQSAVALASVTVDMTYTGMIGTSSEYLKIHATKIDIGEALGTGARTGSSMLKIDADTTASTITIHGTQSVNPGTTPPVLLKANQATTIVHVLSGTVGIAYERAGDVAVIDDLYVGQSGLSTGPTVYIGEGTTVDQVHVYSGTCYCYGDPDDLYVWGGILTLDTTSAIALVRCQGGAIYIDRSGVITLLSVKKGTVDLTRTNHARTITTTVMDASSNLLSVPTVTFTNSPTFSERMTVTMTPAY